MCSAMSGCYCSLLFIFTLSDPDLDIANTRGHIMLFRVAKCLQIKPKHPSNIQLSNTAHTGLLVYVLSPNEHYF